MSESSTTSASESLGPNEWFVEEMRELYRRNPAYVSEDWQAYFAKESSAAPVTNGASKTTNGSVSVPADNVVTASAPSPAPEQARKGQAVAAQQLTPADQENAQALRGVAAKIVTNMEASLGVPTATSVRAIPAKLLEVQRTIVNNQLKRTRRGKVSFTHIICYAVVQAAKVVPAMNSIFRMDGDTPTVIRSPHIGLGLAVDIPKPDGSHSLVVVCIKDAEQMNFVTFWQAYEALIAKVKNNSLTPDDFSGVTITVTNPGTIGTEHSIPRLMSGQASIIGVGAINYPAEFQAADPRALADLGVSKVLSLTSTYDHRVIQGAESGLFLQKVHELLTGGDQFFEEIFESLDVPYSPAQWRTDSNSLEDEDDKLDKQLRVQQLIDAYRTRGHLIADLDPLDLKVPVSNADLDPTWHGLSIWDLDRRFQTGGVGGQDELPLGQILKVLRDAYCRTVGVQYMHIQNPEEKQWIQSQIEDTNVAMTKDEELQILARLNAAEAFEKFLHTKYIGHKRFGLEGGEAAIPLLETILDDVSQDGIHEVVMGMSHRGRLNVLSNIIGVPVETLFRKFEGDIDPESIQGSGDVKYHVGAEGTYTGPSGNAVHITLASNPSHLEAVDAVVEGITRAKQDVEHEPEHFDVLPLVLHGDAAFAGQGVVSETLNMSQLRGYRTGGTVHLVINNQVGFTTNPIEGRSSTYCTDIALTVQAPVFHVNADDPEACVRVAHLATAYRQEFHKDVVIDFVCYRRHGHNEGDEPSYTQPQMYKRIEEKRSVRQLYTEELVVRGALSVEEAEQAMADFSSRLQQSLDATRQSAPPKVETLPDLHPSHPEVFEVADTTAPQEILDQVAHIVHNVPEDFHIHPKLEKQLLARAKMYDDGQIDWALGETLAYGSLVLEGIDVRLAGQDTRRGTFSHRHAVYVDYETGQEYVPIQALVNRTGTFSVYDSSLSEYAALAFEYGYSVGHPNALPIWEAQFGDFANGGQVVVDQFISAAEAKWNQQSSLVLLLPHGYEGQGPEHSSGRMERYLQLCAEDNMTVANVTNSAQIFHLLRRQVKRPFRKPLILFTPKSLLRSKNAYSTIADFTNGHFNVILDDPRVTDANAVNRVVLASGKVAFDAMDYRDKEGLPAAVIRVEQIYPWPEEVLLDTIARYENATDVVWLQEEPENMGAWTFVLSRMHRSLGSGHKLRPVCRAESASPAAGLQALHTLEQQDLIARAFADMA